MDILFFWEIKPYSRRGNEIKNIKRIYYFIIKFIYRTTSFKMVSIKYNKLTHGVYLRRILSFINLFLYTNPGFFKPFLSIIVNLSYPIGIILVNGILSAGLRRRLINRRVIFVISKKKREAYRGKKCIIIYEFNRWQEVLLIGHIIIHNGTEVGL